jgi:hypothetical protein
MANDRLKGDGSSCLTRCAVSGISQTKKNRPRVFDCHMTQKGQDTL